MGRAGKGRDRKGKEGIGRVNAEKKGKKAGREGKENGNRREWMRQEGKFKGRKGKNNWRKREEEN